VQVVDREERGPPEREIRGEPVEPVQHRHRDDVRLVVAPGRGDELEELRRGRRRSREELGPLGGRCGCEQRLEELAHEPVGEVVLELAAARAEHRHPAPLSERASLREESRLADPRPSLDRDEPARAGGSGGDVRLHRGELRLAFEQAGGPRRRRPRRALAEPVAGDLHDRLRPVEPGEEHRAEAPQLELGVELRLDEGGGRLREQHLARRGEACDPRRLMDREADVAVVAERCLARVEADAGLRARRQRALGGHGGRDGAAGARERVEDRVGPAVDRPPAALGEAPVEDGVVLGEQRGVPVRPVLGEKRWRVGDHGEEERDRSGRKAGLTRHAHPSAAVWTRRRCYFA
jgi:hypothetical protein